MSSENSSQNNVSPLLLRRSVFISAGEPSGDLHSSALMSELKLQLSGKDIVFNGLGGSLMISEGLNALYHIKDLATIGFTDVIKKYSFFKKALRNSADYIKKNSPDTVILVDYPGFNLRLAEEIRKFYDKKIIYYISPQLWAWHEKRVFKVKKYIDLMLVLFPFEVDFYSKYGVNAKFTGHPLVKRIDEFIEANPKSQTGHPNKKIITILPGSRKDEVKNHLPVLIDTISELRKQVDIVVNISIAPGLDKVFDEFRDNLSGCNLTTENPYKLILESDLVLTKAGTSTMECALLGTPHLIFYKTFPLNYYLLKPIVKVDKLGIVNILLGEDVVMEFIQNEFTSKKLAIESLKILNDTRYRNKMIESFGKVKQVLGGKDASAEAAKLIIKTAAL
ncbi:MAG: lipid-A-disaccharide synthase [Ignavibacteria bacterium]